MTLPFDASWLKADEDITFIIEMPFGTMIFTTEQMLAWFGDNTFGTYTVTLEKSSLKIGVKKDGKGVSWNKLTPMARIGVPYAIKSGESADNIVVTDKNGRVLPTSAYEKGMVYVDIFASGTYKAVSAKPGVFTDTASHWAKTNIDYVTMRGLINGSSNTAYSPETAITRAEYLAALGKLSDADVSRYKTSMFADVSNDSVYMPYIEWAASNGIVVGIGDNKFAPNAPITREEMAQIMVNYAKTLGYALPNSNNAAIYTDDTNISIWAVNAVAVMQKANIMTGKIGNRFDPQGNTTKAEAATILRRFIENVISSRSVEGWSNASFDLNKRVYYNQNGNAVTGWQTIDGEKYNFGNDGIMRTGWLDANNKRYYLDKNGRMVFGKWLQINNKWYYFYEDGTLAVSTIIDGYEIGADGAKK